MSFVGQGNKNLGRRTWTLEPVFRSMAPSLQPPWGKRRHPEVGAFVASWQKKGKRLHSDVVVDEQTLAVVLKEFKGAKIGVLFGIGFSKKT